LEKSRLLRVEDLRADHIRGQHVGCELNPREARVDGLGETAHGQGLGKAGNAFQEHVPAAQKTREQAADHRLLAHQRLPDLVHEVGTQSRVALYVLLKRSRRRLCLALPHPASPSSAGHRPGGFTIPKSNRSGQRGHR
jgi:hypothetical protein